MSSRLSSSRLVSGLPVAIATIFGCALSLVAERLLNRRNRRRLLEELADVAEPRAKALREQILKSMEVLHSIASFHATRLKSVGKNFDPLFGLPYPSTRTSGFELGPQGFAKRTTGLGGAGAGRRIP